MTSNQSNALYEFFNSNLALFKLKMKASQIKSNYSVKHSLEELTNFVDSNQLRFSNP